MDVTRVFAMTHQEAATAPDVITGKIFLYDIEVYALIDPGSTHSFIASVTASRLHQKPEALGKDLVVSTSLEEILNYVGKPVILVDYRVKQFRSCGIPMVKTIGRNYGIERP